ncbi:unnamed protein product [Closterium sp. NIES-53]
MRGMNELGSRVRSLRGAESEGAESGGAEPRGTASARGPAGDSPRLSHWREPLSPQQLHEWFAQRTHVRSGAAGAGGSAAGGTGAGGAGAAGPRGARTSGTGAAGASGVGGAGAGDPGAGGNGAGDPGARGTGAGGARARGSGAGGAGDSIPKGVGVTARAGGTGGAGAACPGGARTRAGDPGAGGVGVGGSGSGDPGARGTGAGAGGTRAGGTRARGAGAGGTEAGDPGAGGAGAGGAGAGGPGAGRTMQGRPFFIPPQPSSLPPPDSVLCQVLSLPSSTGHTPSLLCPPPHQSQPQLHPNSPLPAPSPYAEQTDSLTECREPESRPASPVCAVRNGRCVPCPRPSSVPLRVPLPPPPASSLPAVPDPESNIARAASLRVPCLLATVVTDPSFESTAASALVAKLVDFAATCRLDYATTLVAESGSACPLSVEGECALSMDVLEDKKEDFECLVADVSHLVAMLLAPEGDHDALDIPTPRSYAEVITGTYVNAVPPSGANIVDGIWIFDVKRPLGSLPAFKVHYFARGFSQRHGVDLFQTFSPTPKITTLRLLLHVAAQRDYELHSLDFSTAFLEGNLHEEIWLRRPPRFTGTTLAALGFAPSTADPSLFLRTDTSLLPSYVLVYVDDLVFATADTEALALVKSELQKRHTCTNLCPSALRLPVLLAIVHSSAYQSLALSSSDESVETSGPYPELVGCLMYLMTYTRPDLAYPLSILARYVAPRRHRPEHWEAAKRVLRYLCSTSGMGLVLEGQGPVVLTGQADASWVDDLATQRSLQGYTFSLGTDSVSWRSTRSSSVLSSSCDAEIYAGAMAAQELH